MAYTINKFSGEELIVLQDGTIDTTTNLGLVGRNYVGYGETQNENFVFLLENFANDAPPSRPLEGQLWFNTSNNIMNVYDGANWKVLGSAELSATAPVDPGNGNLWLKTPDNVVYVWSGSEWISVGPESAAGFGITRARSTTLLDTLGTAHPVILLTVDDIVLGIVAKSSFTIATANSVSGFSDLEAGINISQTATVKGNLNGIAESANRFQTPRRINGVTFDGTADVTLKSSTTNKLIGGDYIVGSDFDGTTETTWSVDASSANQIGKIVARNSAGGFSASTITADLVGDVTGNVTATSGTSRFDVVEATRFIGATLSGNSLTATQLQTARNINGVSFDGSQDVTVPAAAGTLTGTSINSTVIYSNLQRLGLLESLRVLDDGIEIGGTQQFKLYLDSTSTPTIGVAVSNKELKFEINDPLRPLGTELKFVPSSQALGLSGDNAPALIPGTNGNINLGTPDREFDKIYANNFVGNADTATLSTSANNLVGGGAGTVAYQTAEGVTSFIAAGTPGYVLTAQAGNSIAWSPSILEQLIKKSSDSYLVFSGGSGTYYDGQTAVTLSVDATSTNTPSKVVARDSSGNFSAGTVTANLVGNVTGNASGNAGTATKLQTARNINGVAFDGTANITVVDSTRVAKTGDTMSGFLTLHANPTQPLHAVPKQYVDSLGLTEPLWAGATTFSSVTSTYSSAPVGTTVAYWEERVYTRGSGNGAAITVEDRYRRTIRKISLPNTWQTVGG